MKDREKQIEEMQEMICGCASPCNLEDWEDCDKLANCSKVKKIAKALHLAGYRKLPEDSIVLSREEYDKLKYAWITDSEVYKKASKETAEKIYDFVESYIMDDAEAELLVKQWFEEQFGVEIKES